MGSRTRAATLTHLLVGLADGVSIGSHIALFCDQRRSVNPAVRMRIWEWTGGERVVDEVKRVRRWGSGKFGRYSCGRSGSKSEVLHGQGNLKGKNVRLEQNWNEMKGEEVPPYRCPMAMGGMLDDDDSGQRRGSNGGSGNRRRCEGAQVYEMSASTIPEVSRLNEERRAAGVFCLVTLDPLG